MPQSNEAALAAPPSGWLPQDVVCEMLGKSKRRLNELIEAGELQLEKCYVQRRGKRPAVYFHPGDVERTMGTQAPRPTVIRPEQPAIAPLELLAELLERMERRPPLDAAWLTIRTAAGELGLAPSTLRAVALQRLEAGDRDVYCDRAGMLRIRRAAAAAIGAQELLAADAVIRQRRAALVAPARPTALLRAAV